MKILLIIVTIFIELRANANKVITISGYNLPNIDRTAIDFKLDPFTNRLLCPSLSRLNILKKKSEALILKSITSKIIAQKTQWIYSLRSGLFWWNGDRVSLDDVQNFISQQLKAYIKQNTLFFKTPSYSISSSSKINKRQITISWNNKPRFGEFFLNNLAFTRKASNPVGFECVGLYQPVFKQLNKRYYSFKPSAKYKRLKNNIKFKQLKSKTAKNTLNFWSAQDYQLSIKSQFQKKIYNCMRTVPTNKLLRIKWNLENSIIRNSLLRKTFGKLIPKKHTIRFAAKGLGQEIFGLYPSFHPGSNSNLKNKFTPLWKVIKLLDKSGYTRASATHDRKLLDGSKFKLNIQSTPQTPILLKKIIIDSFYAVGITVNIKNSFKNNIHGFLNIRSLKLPNLDYIKDFHSKFTSSKLTQPLLKLDSLLEKYHTSLTTKAPDFAIAKKINLILNQQEFESTFFLQKQCLASKNVNLSKINFANPDWFKKIILTFKIY